MPMTLDVPRTRDPRPDAGIASSAAGGDSLVAASRLVAEPIVQPIYGRIAPDERRADFLAVATIAERLSRTAGAACLAFGDYLRDLCAELAATFGRSGGPTLTCTAADMLLPVGPAITLGLIAEGLVGHALSHAFPAGQAGRIAVSFGATSRAFELAVEDSGIAVRAEHSRPENGLLVARLLVLQLEGELETGRVIGGTRCVVAIPRPPYRT
jgi:two-component sensor histidine kinase